MSPFELDTELAAFVESGVVILVGSRDAQLVPDCCNGCGARVEPGRQEITVFLPVATAESVIANLADNSRVAVSFGRITDDHCVQLKGRVLAIAEATESDNARLSAYHQAMVQSYGWAGAPPALSARINFWPAWAVRLAIESKFLQTPGPGAGEPLGADPFPAKEHDR